jgi:ethanolamine ammonia-lyase small subunit
MSRKPGTDHVFRVAADPWSALRRLTPARIALGRSGASLPTEEVLRFGVAHALARDAVHQALDADRLEADLRDAGFESVRVRSRASDRRTYLLRPDLGRRLAEESAQALRARRDAGADVCVVIADGLSSAAVQRHALPLLAAFRDEARSRWSLAPVVIAEQGRVALGDEIGEIVKARLAAILIGERPGLSSPDSLGVYLTWEPRVGRNDGERNCVSNVRPEGLVYAEAARKTAWLIGEAFRLRLTGVALKDQSDRLIAGSRPTALRE